MTHQAITPIGEKVLYHPLINPASLKAQTPAAGIASHQKDQFSLQPVRFGATSSTKSEESDLPASSEALPETVLFDNLPVFPFQEAIVNRFSEKVNTNQKSVLSTTDLLQSLMQPAIYAARNLRQLMVVYNNPEAHSSEDFQRAQNLVEHLETFLPRDVDMESLNGRKIETFLGNQLAHLQQINLMSPGTARRPKPMTAPESKDNFIVRMIKAIISFLSRLLGLSHENSRSSNFQPGLKILRDPELTFTEPLKRLLSGFIIGQAPANRNFDRFINYLLGCEGKSGVPSEVSEAASIIRQLKTDLVTHIMHEPQMVSAKGSPGEYQNRLNRLKQNNLLTHEQAEVIQGYVEKLKDTNPLSPEYGVYNTLLKGIFKLPWEQKASSAGSKLSVNERLAAVRKALDEDHFGMNEIKDNIIEHLAVQLHKEQAVKAGKVTDADKASKAKIICLVGPPGVGKTSIGKSVARALNKPFQRVALGGVHNEIEIRGSRLGFMNAKEGRIMEAVRKAGAKDAVILLDEIDKLATGNTMHGDPSAALLEALDPEQNNKFEDHYFGFGYDLSKITFIVTANDLKKIPAPLRGRLEVINIDGYTPSEKEKIAQGWTVPKVQKQLGLTKEILDVQKENEAFTLPPETIQELVNHYAPGRGVREMEQMIEKVGRKVLLSRLKNNETGPINPIQPKELETYLKGDRLVDHKVYSKPRVGYMNGLFYSEGRIPGGTLPTTVKTYIRPVENPKDGGLFLEDSNLTGLMGDVMKQSARCAFNYVKTHANELGIQDKLNKNRIEVFVHVDDGDWVEKDGPSAGAAMATAIISALTEKVIPAAKAMTGTIGVDGEIGPIGGVPWKIMGAKREGADTVYLPEKNRQNYDILPEEVKAGIRVKFVKTIDDMVQDFQLRVSKGGGRQAAVATSS